MRHGGFVDGRVLVGLQVDEGIVRDAFGGGRLCKHVVLLASPTIHVCVD